MPETKQYLRKKIIQKRNNITADAAQKAAQSASGHFFSNIMLSKDDIVAAYIPTNGEISPLLILQELNNQNITTCLPYIAGKDKPLLFKKWKIGEGLHKSNFFNIDEPEKYSQNLVPSIIITPLVAFDKCGNRLGYGGGFYDRTIPKLKEKKPDIKTIGIAYGLQMAEKLPKESHDHLLDAAITENEFINFNLRSLK